MLPRAAADAVTSCPCKVSNPANQPYCTLLSIYRQICELNGIFPYACEASLKVTASLAPRNNDGEWGDGKALAFCHVLHFD